MHLLQTNAQTMKTRILPTSLLLCLLFTLACWPGRALSGDAPKNSPDIYDVKAEGSKQISDALAVAKKEHKHVLLQFGANWCGWCHKLHKLCETDKTLAAKL